MRVIRFFQGHMTAISSVINVINTIQLPGSQMQPILFAWGNVTRNTGSKFHPFNNPPYRTSIPAYTTDQPLPFQFNTNTAHIKDPVVSGCQNNQ